MDEAVKSRTLLPHWAFVVQFRGGTNMPAGRVVGRVEHVVSGQVKNFQSLEELLAFMAAVLEETAATEHGLISRG